MTAAPIPSEFRPRPRHVVVLNDYLHVQGGASRVAVDEALALAEAGVEVTFLGANGPACPELARSRVRLVDLGQPELLDAGRSPRVILQNFWNAKAYRAMGEVLAELDPARTVVHLHGYTKALTLAPVRLAAERGFATVCTLHDFFAACPNGAFFDYVENRPCARVALSGACVAARCDKRSHAHKLFRVARGFAQRHLAGFPGNVRDFIALSQRSAEILRPYLPPDAHVDRLDNVIPVERRPPADVARNVRLIAVGRLDREKGVEVLLAAARFAGLGVTFVGDGPLRPLVEAEPNMTVTGWLPAAEVMREVEQARALVFPSLWYETFGLVVSEAAARGVPAIVSDVSAASERVRDGRSGWVAPAGDVAALAGALRMAVDDANEAARRGAEAYRAFWADPPTPERHAMQLLAIHAGVLARRQGAHSLRLSAPPEVAA